MLSPARSVFGRVAILVVVAGMCALALATVGVTWVVSDAQESALVESAIRRTEAIRSGIDQRLALGRAELRSVALAAEGGRVLEAPSLVSGSVQAIRCVQHGNDILDAATSTGARRTLREAATPPPGGVTLLRDNRVVIAHETGDVEAWALHDLSSLLGAPAGGSLAITQAGDVSGEDRAVRATRFRDRGDAERVLVRAGTADGLALRLTAPLAPARAAAYEVTKRVLLWSTLAVLPLLLLAWVGARAVTRPIRALAAAVRGARGDRLELPNLPRDEIGDLGSAIAGMSARLRDNAQSLRAAVTFARGLGGLAAPDALLAALEHALREALPSVHWQVVSSERIAAGDLPVDLGVSPEAARHVLGASRPSDNLPEDSTRPVLVHRPKRRPGVGVSPDVILGLCDASHDYAIVVGLGEGLDDEAVRHAELLSRTAVAALRNQELLRLAATNEKLLAVGRLAAGVAHEMNNPLAFVLANLQAIEPRLSGEELEAVREARHGTERLVRIVRDLSSLSRGGSSLELSDVDLAELALFVARVGSGRIQGVELVVEAPEPVRVRGDRGRLEQVLLNLFVNAVDATRGRPSPRVQVRVWREGDEGVAEVSDNGLGVSLTAHGQLFAPFFTTKGAQGTGLGLYLSRSFAQAHGGDLVLKRTGAEGTTFELRVPATRSSAPPTPVPEPAPTLPSRRPPPRVLIVDDEEALIRAMKRWIGARASVTECSDPARALDIATQEQFGLILCDLNMPGMSGTDFVEALYLRNAVAASRVVIMTGMGAGSIESRVRVVGKPIAPALLEELLDAT